MKTKIALAITALIIAATIAATEAHKQDVTFVPYEPGYPVYMPGYPIDVPVVATPTKNIQPTVEPTPIKDPSI